MGLFDKFKAGLQKSRESFVGRIETVFKGNEIGDEFFDQLEETMIMNDVGGETAMRIVDNLRDEVVTGRIKNTMDAKESLVGHMMDCFDNRRVGDIDEFELDPHLPRPFLILVVGVNGSGKTTTIAKLAHRWMSRGKKVMLVAGDTFRAAAIEQLETWGSRVGAEVIRQQPGSDPSAVFYDALQAAKSRGVDIVIGDTAGRLHTKVNLMDEIKKIHRICGRIIPGAPHQVLLVIDATTGQNGLIQAQKFNESAPVDSIVLTKLDGTARGGIAIAIKEKLNLPILYVGLGEKIDDLEEFIPEYFIRCLIE